MTTSRELAEATAREVDRWLETWPTADIAGPAWRDYGRITVCDSDDEMVREADAFAPEHLEVQTRDPIGSWSA